MLKRQLECDSRDWERLDLHFWQFRKLEVTGINQVA